jgi:molybdopterin synthase catalytic subunit
MIRIAVEPAPIDIAAALAALEIDGAGAVASFTGLVRGEGGLLTLTLEHYPGMTEAALAGLADEAIARWPIAAVTILHRTGPMVPGDRIVFVGTVSAHRAAALDACGFLIDALKTRAPFWKRERFADGRDDWVAARAGDEAAVARWG